MTTGSGPAVPVGRNTRSQVSPTGPPGTVKSCASRRPATPGTWPAVFRDLRYGAGGDFGAAGLHAREARFGAGGATVFDVVVIATPALVRRQNPAGQSGRQSR